MTQDEFHRALDARSQEIVELLGRADWRFWNRSVPRNAELRKNLGRLRAAIADARRLEREGRLDEEARTLLGELLKQAPTRSTDALGEVLEEVDQALIAAGDAAFLCALLELEYERDEQEGGAGVTTWRTLYDGKPLAASVTYARGGIVDQTSLEEARRKLSMLHHARQALYALGRARTGTKAARLAWLAPVMAGLALALVVAVDLAADDASWREGLLVAVAGAVGATLSGALKLRDQLPRITGLRTFWSAFALQVPIGAVAGLFLWIVLESGLVEIAEPGADWAVEAAVAFAAGFSEPFVLKTVERIAGGGDSRPG